MAQKHCIDVETSRRLHEDAVKLRDVEVIADSLQSQVVVLESEKNTLRSDYEQIFREKDENDKDFRQQLRNEKGVSASHEEENKHLKKKVRTRTWQRNALGVIALALLVLSVVN